MHDWKKAPKGFASTHWSLVLQAGRGDDSAARAALAELCQAYWYPLYAFVRRQVPDPHEAQDLTQEFFARLLEKNWVNAAHPERGRFRSFLLTAMQHFLANERDRHRAQKRGGGKIVLSLDWQAGEERFTREPVHHWSADRLFERHWALTLLGRVLELLKMEMSEPSQRNQFDHLKAFLTGDSPESDQVAKTLDLSPGALRVAVHRLRKRYRELLKAEVANTVAGEEEVEEEIRKLFECLGP